LRDFLSSVVQSDKEIRRVLFLSSNGVGLGHLTRLLAVARRLPPDIEPVFATMSQALGVVERMGFHAEYLPFHVYAECDVEDWNRWLRRQLTQIIEYYGISGVVFDGSNPYFGLIEAVAPRPDVFLAWIRRGMWRAQQVNQPIIERQRFFDLIIEPSDIADARDEGITIAHRDRAVRTDPIRLLDQDDLLDRAAAAAELGIDSGKPAVLIQLGAGSNRDIVQLTNSILAACRRHPDLQVVLAEWAITTRPMDLWPDLHRLRGYPMSRYYRAFDFTISAAGYNSFNEILSFGLPAIFVANESPTMDDQGGRARYAEDQGAGFAIPESDLDGLEQSIDMMMQPAARALLRANCLRLSRPNGADEAVALVARLLGKEVVNEGIDTESASRDAEDERAVGAAASAHHGAGAAIARNGGHQRIGQERLRSVDADSGSTCRSPRSKGKIRKTRKTKPRILADKNRQPSAPDTKTGTRKLRTKGNGIAGNRDLSLRVHTVRSRRRRRNGGTAAVEET
jgi:UDP:flavonoid glycosyltransferase YjiC (YdhE family)